MVDDFEIVPEKEVSNLKKEISKLKQDPLGQSEAGSKLYTTMDNLNESMNNMLNLFKIAADGMQNEEKEEVFLAEKIKPLFEKVDKVIDQNEKIAKALVAIADMIDDLKNNRPEDPVGDLRGNISQNNTSQGFIPNNSSNNSVNSNSNLNMPQNNFGSSMNNSNLNQGNQMNSAPQNNSNNFSNSNNASGAFPSPFLDDNNSGNGSTYNGANLGNLNNNSNNSANQGLPSFGDFSKQNPDTSFQNQNKMRMPPPPNQNSQAPEEKHEKKGLFGLKK